MRGAPDPRASTGRLRGLTSLAKGSQLSRFPRPVVTPGSFHPSGTLRVHFPWSTSQASAVAGKMGRRRSRAAGTCVTICGARSSCVNVGASGSPAGLSRRPISMPTGFALARIAEQHQKGRNDLRRRQDQHQRARSGRGQALLDRYDGILADHRRAHRGGAQRRALESRSAPPHSAVTLVLYSLTFDASRLGSLSPVLFTCDDIQRTHQELTARGVEFPDPPG